MQPTKALPLLPLLRFPKRVLPKAALKLAQLALKLARPAVKKVALLRAVLRVARQVARPKRLLPLLTLLKVLLVKAVPKVLRKALLLPLVAKRVKAVKKPRLLKLPLLP